MIWFPHPLPSQWLGVDFSGARFPAPHIWICHLQQGERTLRLKSCFPLSQVLGRRADRESCYRYLRRFLADLKDAVIGLDFPFSLPATLLPTQNWQEMLFWFSERFEHPEAFRQYFARAGGQGEFKRWTDQQAGAPFSPGNLRLFKQTYYGLREILAPLKAREAVCVLPFDLPEQGKPWLLEVCPASFLKKRGLYHPYKSRSETRRAQRRHIVNSLNKHLPFRLQIPSSIEQLLVDDAPGDALDSLLAALSARLGVEQFPRHSRTEQKAIRLEGWIFF